MKPMDIERESFAIIKAELGDRTIDPEYDLLVRRVIHTTADFDYYENLCFSEHAVLRMKEAIRKGCDVITDTTMAQSGINKKILAQFGGEARCFIADPDVAAEAKERGVTRSLVSMEKAARLEKPLIFAVGNAPTALFSICDLIRAGKWYAVPDLVWQSGWKFLGFRAGRRYRKMRRAQILRRTSDPAYWERRFKEEE